MSDYRGNQIRHDPDGGVMGSGWASGCGGCGGGGGSLGLAAGALTINEFAEISSVPQGVESTIVSFTVPIMADMLLVRVEFGGSNIAKYSLYFDGSLKNSTWTWFNGPMFGHWEYGHAAGGQRVTAGTIIRVKVLHDRPSPGEFKARIEGIIVPLPPP